MTPTQVIKVGGSLLRREGLLADLQTWLAARQSQLADPTISVWIIGGGVQVDAIRKQDRFHGLTESVAHWASVEAMDANAQAIAQQLQDWRLTKNPNEIRQATAMPDDNSDNNPAEKREATQNWILQTLDWLKAVDDHPQSPQSLPHSWDVTSDSIAAWAAIQLRAKQLVLLKSCHVPKTSVSELASLGIVDAYLPKLELQRKSVGLGLVCERLPSSCTNETLVTRNHTGN